MSWRFRRTKTIAPGVRLTIGKRGLGISVGTKGLRVGIGPKGAYQSIGISGTGLYSINYLGNGRKRSASGNRGATATNTADTISSIPLFGKDDAIPLTWVPPVVTIVGGLTLLGSQTLGAATLFVGGALGWWFLAKHPRRRASQALDRAKRHLNTGNWEAADAQAAKALETNPAATQGHYIRGVSLAQLGHYDEALEHLDAVPVQAPFLKALRMQVTVSAGKYDESLLIHAELPQEWQENPGIRTLRAEALMGLDKHDLAIEVLKAGPIRNQIKGDAALLQLHYLLGRAYEATNKKAMAKKSYARVVADTPGYEDAEERWEALG